jgi:hypothetical protein
MKTALLILLALSLFGGLCYGAGWMLYVLWRDDPPAEDGFTPDITPEDPYGQDGE